MCHVYMCALGKSVFGLYKTAIRTMTFVDESIYVLLTPSAQGKVQLSLAAWNGMLCLSCVMLGKLIIDLSSSYVCNVMLGSNVALLNVSVLFFILHRS